jgi:allophanate hydrolase subunit 2
MRTITTTVFGLMAMLAFGQNLVKNGTSSRNAVTDSIVVTKLDKTLKYGDVIHLQNGWNKDNGGYLDVRGYQKDFEKTLNYLCVSTAISNDRDNGSGSWRVISTTGKANGTPVLAGDNIHLLNQWSNENGGYLDVWGYQKDFEETGNHLCVSTALLKNRDNGSGSWRIISTTGKANGTPILEGDDIHLLNQWSNENGGYLDTRGYQKDFEKTGNHLCVSTALLKNRDDGSGTWKVLLVSKKHLNVGEKLNKVGAGIACSGKEFKIAEDKKIYEKTNNNWVHIGDRSNGLFCEGSVLYCNSTDGTIWRYNNTPHAWTPGNTLQKNQELKTNQKLVSKNGEYYLVLQEDANLCVYKKDNTFVWCAMTELKGGTQLIMQNDGNLCLYTAQSAHVWSTDTYRGGADKTGHKLVLEDNGMLVLYNVSGKAIWNNKQGRLY